MSITSRFAARKQSTEDTTQALAPGAILALLPSRGVGGGIENYCRSVLQHIPSDGVVVNEVALLEGASALPTPIKKLSFAIRAGRIARRERGNLRILCFHAGLLPVALLCQLLAPSRPSLQLVCYGNEIWKQSSLLRFLLRHSSAHLVAISDFTAGALAAIRPASILPPSLSSERRDLLLAVRPGCPKQSKDALRILTVFRLADFDSKGGHILIAAIEEVRARGEDIVLTVAGKSEADATALDATFQRIAGWADIVRDPTDGELANLYAAADLFVLATRSRGGRHPRGEGFGIVLLEAATAGLPVIAPWSGGGHAALLEGITGMRPADQSASSLAILLRWAFYHRSELTLMGQNGRSWVTRHFSPEAYRDRVAEVVLGRPAAKPATLSLQLVPASVREIVPDS